MPLTREAVDGFVFWTRNAALLLPDLEEILQCGFAFIVQYGIIGEAKDAIRNMHVLAEAYGRCSTVWRCESIAIG